MAEVVIMPKLGFNMDEGQLVSWLKKVGDEVKKGEGLFEINTDKTTIAVDATIDGVLLKVMLDEGRFAAVFTPIAVLGSAGEDPDAALAAYQSDAGGSAQAPASAAGNPPAATPVHAGEEPASVATTLKLTPKARKLIRDEGLDPASIAGIAGTGYQGGITAKDIKASPLARKLAEREGVNLAAAKGTGPGGKIMKADVERAIGEGQPAPAADALGKIVASVAPYKGVRRIIGERLAKSKLTAPHLYFTESIDTGNLTAFRKQINESGDIKVAVSDLLVMAASRALCKYPGINVSLDGENIVTYASTNIGVAVAGENGLIVPVIKNVQSKTLSDVARESRDLVERAKVGRLLPDEFAGGTFSISNLGMFGIENFTAIINPPESAILAVSSVRKSAVVVADADGNDSIEIRPMMNVQLTVDHRLIDGLLAVQFLGCFKSLLENPVRILL